ncbi:hypothetical protein CRI94_03975 [Longibacter salinarum]|uniref:Uncharacterized protein n=1 Tax=Longibacter salinarum TaxID=1850348 RepID=A0A2A8CZU4_9BACT|nr:hypothetical protein [Longibacter salinarum]PEN14205.1 hypothetical protein CRI94_03975 [Longibacter salinarum]
MSSKPSPSDAPVSSVARNTETRPTTDEPTSNFSLSAAAVAGLGAGLVFLLLELLASALGAGTPIGPARATIKDVVDLTPGQYTTRGFISTLAIHFALSLAATAVLARLVHHWKTFIAIIIGGAFGGFLYTANVALTWTIAPDIAIGGKLALIANYIIFGAAAALIYKVLQHPDDREPADGTAY